jgi:hypothetical protein
MAIDVQLQIIDADAHVSETEHTWDYLEPAEQQLRANPTSAGGFYGRPTRRRGCIPSG